MSTIGTQLQQGGYYSLGQSGGAGVGSGGRVNPAARAYSNATQAANASSGSSAYLIDLSPEAQRYLSGLNQPQAAAAAEAQAAVNDGFVLNNQQRVALAALLERFKDEPYTQETFDKIQDALQQDDLGPNQLSARLRATSFSTTAALVDALNGGDGSTPGAKPMSDAELQSRSGQYIQFVAAEWRKVSTTADDAEGEGASEAISAVEGSGAAS